MNIMSLPIGKEAKELPNINLAGLAEPRYAFLPQVHIKR